MKRKKPNITMDKLTEGYEKFIENKDTIQDSKKLFEKTIKKAAKTKQHGLK
ncbi:hypothetical protein BH11BAC5_BH11BAC5_43130 [soil metagenome]